MFLQTILQDARFNHQVSGYMFRLSVSHLQASFVQITNYMLRILRIMGFHAALQVIKINLKGC
jgi:hypothetical protein